MHGRGRENVSLPCVSVTTEPSNSESTRHSLRLKTIATGRASENLKHHPSRYETGDDEYVRALVRLLPSMSPLVGPHVAPLIGFEVAEGALKRLFTSVRALMYSDLPGGEKESAKPLRVNKCDDGSGLGPGLILSSNT
jgi:hypothetical protein